MQRGKGLGRGAAACVTAAACALLAACGAEEGPATLAVRHSAPVSVPEASEPRDVAVVSVRGFGEIHIELLHDLAPRTVDNFIELAEREFYYATTFHRIIPGFAIQGGDPNSRDRDPRNDGMGGPGYNIEDEFSDVSHLRGVVSMANKGRPSSAGSQFFIVVGDSLSLDGKYTVFGHVTDGMDVVDRIAKVERDKYGRRGPRDRPLENVVIESVRIDRGAGGRSVIAEGEDPEPHGRIDLSPRKGGGTPTGTPEDAPAALPAAMDPSAL